MSGRDLTEKYGRRQVTSAMNAAIRAEIPGGEEILELLPVVYRLAHSTRSNEFEAAKFHEILDVVQTAHRKMKRAVAEKYGVASREE